MPCTMYRDYRVSFTPTSYGQSYTPTQRKVTIQEAIRRAVKGDITASEIFGQCPAAVQQAIDDTCQQAFRQKFLDLSGEEQTSVFAAILVAFENTGSGQQPAREKKWWQFWK